MLELREMCGKMESSKQVTLTADLLKNSSRVLVRNIAAHFENADILKMYFESNKSGGSENGVEDICLVENGIAVVTFVDSKGISYRHAVSCIWLKGARYSYRSEYCFPYQPDGHKLTYWHEYHYH